MWGVSTQGDVWPEGCLPGGYLPGGIGGGGICPEWSAQGTVCSGVSAQGGVYIPACNGADTPPPCKQND